MARETTDLDADEGVDAADGVDTEQDVDGLTEPDTADPTPRDRRGRATPRRRRGVPPDYVPRPELTETYLDDTRVEEQRRIIHRVVDLAVVAICVGFVLWHLQPDLLLRNTTPAGGDMGAHVWGPAYLRDHLLPHGQVAGWSGDWYAGFPAYQFYMVLPSLAIVLLNAGFHGTAAFLPAVAGIVALGVAAAYWRDRRRRRLALVAAGVAFALVGLPYGVAFKLVTVLGVVSLPVCAYAFGRLAGLRFPTPAVFSAATLPFLFYRGYTIYGGNIASTLAGEFAFSISLSLGLLYLGVVFKGLETGRYRVLAAVLLALTGLCHIIPAFWVLGATAIAVAVRFRLVWESVLPGLPLVGAGVLVSGIGLALGAPSSLLGLGRPDGGGRDRRRRPVAAVGERALDHPVAGGRWPAVDVVGRALLPAVGLPQRHGLGEAALRRRGAVPVPRVAPAPDALRHARRRPALGVRAGPGGRGVQRRSAVCGPGSS